MLLDIFRFISFKRHALLRQASRVFRLAALAWAFSGVDFALRRALQELAAEFEQKLGR
jgi:hypothetical protein